MAEHAQTAESMTPRTANGSEVKVQLPPSESTSATGSHLALTVDQSTAENSPCRFQLQETSEAFLKTRMCGDRSKTLPSQEAPQTEVRGQPDQSRYITVSSAPQQRSGHETVQMLEAESLRNLLETEALMRPSSVRRQ